MTEIISEPSQLPAAFEKAINSGDLDAAMAVFASDAIMRTPQGEILTGQALREYNAGTIAGNGRLTNAPSRIVAAADTALISEEWTLEVTTPDGSRIKAEGTTANVARRGVDGGWRMVIFNPLGTA
jgi:ketosteroid isomerase-like protein